MKNKLLLILSCLMGLSSGVNGAGLELDLEPGLRAPRQHKIEPTTIGAASSHAPAQQEMPASSSDLRGAGVAQDDPAEILELGQKTERFGFCPPSRCLPCLASANKIAPETDVEAGQPPEAKAPKQVEMLDVGAERREAREIADQRIIGFIEQKMPKTLNDYFEENICRYVTGIIRSFSDSDAVLYAADYKKVYQQISQSDQPKARLLTIAGLVPNLINHLKLAQEGKGFNDQLKQKLAKYHYFFRGFMDYLSTKYEKEEEIAKFANFNWNSAIPEGYQRFAIAYSLVSELVYDGKYKELTESTLYKETLSMIREYMGLFLNNSDYFDPQIKCCLVLRNNYGFHYLYNYLPCCGCMHDFCYTELCPPNCMHSWSNLDTADETMRIYNSNLVKINEKYPSRFYYLKPPVQSSYDLKECMQLLDKEIQLALDPLSVDVNCVNCKSAASDCGRYAASFVLVPTTGVLVTGASVVTTGIVIAGSITINILRFVCCCTQSF